MKILVMSDSHGNTENMIRAVQQEKPDRIFHLGDCWRDTAELLRRFPEIPLDQVPGNCDYTDEKHTRLLIVEGKKIMITHGHDFAVKNSLLTIQMAALEKGADAVLFGHTHRQFFEYHNGLMMLNPGSIGQPPYGNAPSYGILEITGEKLTADTRRLQQ